MCELRVKTRGTGPGWEAGEGFPREWRSTRVTWPGHSTCQGPGAHWVHPSEDREGLGLAWATQSAWGGPGASNPERCMLPGMLAEAESGREEGEGRPEHEVKRLAGLLGAAFRAGGLSDGRGLGVSKRNEPCVQEETRRKRECSSLVTAAHLKRHRLFSTLRRPGKRRTMQTGKDQGLGRDESGSTGSFKGSETLHVR